MFTCVPILSFCPTQSLYATLHEDCSGKVALWPTSLKSTPNVVRILCNEWGKHCQFIRLFKPTSTGAGVHNGYWNSRLLCTTASQIDK